MKPRRPQMNGKDEHRLQTLCVRFCVMINDSVSDKEFWLNAMLWLNTMTTR
jgi:hypothetical protein